MRLSHLLCLLLLLAGCAPTLGDDDDSVGDDDDSVGDDDDDSVGDDDDDSVGDDDDSVGDDDDSVGDDDDDTGWGCDEVLMPLAPDLESPLGFSGVDVLAPILGPITAAATWSSTGQSTELSVTVSMSGDPVFHDLSQPANPPPGGPDILCLDWLEVPVQLTFQTEEGAFDERVPASVRQDEQGPAWLSAALDWEALGGTFTFTEIDPAEWDEVQLSLSNSWDNGSMTGQVNVNANRGGRNGGVSEGMVGPVLLW